MGISLTFGKHERTKKNSNMDHFAHFWKATNAQKKTATWIISLTFGKQRTHKKQKTATWIISLTFGKQRTHKKKQQHGSFRSLLESMNAQQKTATWIISLTFGKQ